MILLFILFYLIYSISDISSLCVLVTDCEIPSGFYASLSGIVHRSRDFGCSGGLGQFILLTSQLNYSEKSYPGKQKKGKNNTRLLKRELTKKKKKTHYFPWRGKRGKRWTGKLSKSEKEKENNKWRRNHKKKQIQERKKGNK